MRPSTPPPPPIDHRRPPAPYPQDPVFADDRSRSLGDLFRELGTEARTLVRQEIELAKTEARTKIGAARKPIGYLAGGGLLAYAGALVLLISLSLLLGTVLPDWLGFLIVGGLAAGIGYALINRGRTALKMTDFSLERTAETLQEDIAWMKEEANEIKRDPANLGAQG